MRARAKLLAAALITLAPAAAAACPSCAGNSRPDAARFVLLGSLVFLPFAIATVVIRLVRRLDTPRMPETKP